MKQSVEHDPDGRFLRRWLPELRELPTELLHAPWQATPLERLLLNADYPAPIVDCTQSYRQARDRLWAMREDPRVKREGQRILSQHVERR